MRIVIYPLFLCLSIQFGSLSAQVSIGNRAGISMFKSAFGDAEESTISELRNRVENTIGISIALPIEIMLSDHFALQPEIGYTMKGNTGTNSAGGSQTTTLNYLDATLLAKGRIGSGKVQAEVMLGPGLAYGLSARYHAPTDPYSFNYYSDRTLDFADTFYAPTEVFIAGGAGISVALGVPRLFLNYRYIYGITNIFSDEIIFTDITGATIYRIKEYNRGSIVSLGFLVPLSRQAWAPAEEKN